MSGGYTGDGRGPSRPGQGGRAGGHGGRGGYGDQERARRRPADPRPWDEAAWRPESGRQEGGWQDQPGSQHRGTGQFPPRAADPQRPAPQPDWRGTGPRQTPPGAPWQRAQQQTGSRPAQRGADPAQASRGRDPRTGAPRRTGDERYAGDNYPPRGDGRSGRDDYESWDRGGSDDAFLPGVRADDARGRRGRRGRDGGHADGGEYGEYEDASRGRRDDGRRGHDGLDDDWGDLGARRPRRGPVRRLVPWIALLIVLAPLVGGGYYAYSRYQSKYHPADYAGSGSGPTVTVQVKAGDSASSIGPELASLGVIASARSLVLAAESSTNTSGLEPGFYKLNRHMKASLAYAALLNPKNRVQGTFTLREGQRVAQVIASLSSLMHVPVSQFENIVNHPSQLGLPSYAVSSVPGLSSKVIGYKVEGFLWPATYSIQPNETPLQVMRAMVAQYNQVAQQHNFAAEARQRGLSVYQLLIEASIVQAEAGNAAQMPKIARVIENRFNVPMALQFDSILEYGQNTFSVNIQDAQSSIPGPYNDFQHTGLPPTPISNPGLDAINGVLHPANGNWLFFLAQPNGSSLFCHNQPSSATATSCPPGG